LKICSTLKKNERLNASKRRKLIESCGKITSRNTNSSTLDKFQLPYQAVMEGDDEVGGEDGTRYTRTTEAEWSKVEVEDGEDEGGRRIDPIEWTGGSDDVVNITDEELKSLRDVSGEIRFEKVFEWCLPRFGVDGTTTLFEWQAARMRNYMTYRIAHGWTPKYYTWDKVITADHVARFYGACLAKMLMGNRSISQIFCSREFFNAVPPIQASMPKNALEDLTICLHYSDDWECTDNWDDIYDDPQVRPDATMASHRIKHGMLEDAYNKVCTVCCCCCCYYDPNRFLITFFPSFFHPLTKRWQAIVNPGKWITTDDVIMIRINF
jgi:hypothetical protein